MPSSELLLAVRNILLFQMVLVIIAPGPALLLCRELLNAWKRIYASFEPKKTESRKPNKFWEIDFSKFEP